MRFQKWLEASQPDIAGFQEVKAQPSQVDTTVWENLGYSATWHPAERPGYSGALLLTKLDIPVIRIGMDDAEFDAEGRVIQAELPEITVITSYFPNGGKGDRLPFKFAFYEKFLAMCDAIRASGRSVVFMGDMNIAHSEADVARPDEAIKGTGFLPEERAWLDKIAEHGYVDTFRSIYPDAREAYTYWDAWRERRARNIGWRIDYVFVSPDLVPRVEEAFIESEYLGSDHCPIGIRLRLD